MPKRQPSTGSEKKMSVREAGNLIKDIWREDTMWERQGQTDIDEDLRASEAARQRLEALEKQLRDEEEETRRERARLRDEEEENRREKARLRAEELKNRKKEPERVTSQQARETAARPAVETISLVHEDATQIYMEVLLLAYRDGKPAKAQEDVLARVRKRLGITDEEHATIEQKVRMDVYSQAITGMWQHGVGTTKDFEKLDLLREDLNISADDHMRIERQARRQALLSIATQRRSRYAG